ncbi:hypothetical protein DSO57_1030898 [Entomophthora muscae]|uniref:Uncharacterized protein n=1 Tax=Entomophthora muscae TaxID=34485 RepID=A0ACC2UL80_9FUNG|nr:hypothetical protein DSO57_1030898 [Entomophthora muscae]
MLAFDFLIISNIALGWAASTGKERDFESLEELPNPPTFGISRLGSGSHVMSYCLASKQGWDSETIAFQVLGDLAGLASGVKKSKADLFLWEKFTTKPLYDSGSLKYIGEIVAPWLSFIIVTHRNFLRKSDSLNTLKKFMNLINTQVASFVSQPDTSCQEVSRRFNYKPEDVASWWSGVKYPSNLHQIPLEKIEACASMLAPSSNATLPASLISWFLEEVAEVE